MTPALWLQATLDGSAASLPAPNQLARKFKHRIAPSCQVVDGLCDLVVRQRPAATVIFVGGHDARFHGNPYVEKGLRERGTHVAGSRRAFGGTPGFFADERRSLVLVSDGGEHGAARDRPAI